MRARSAQSAARKRLETQLERLGELPPETPLRALRPAADDATRFTLRVGKLQLGPVHAQDVDDLRIAVGQPLDHHARSRLADALAREAARSDALRLLRARSRSKRDLIGRLVGKGHDRTHAAATVERLERVGLVDDRALAHTRAELLAEAARLGPRGAEGKLRAIGIDAGVSGQAVAAAYAGVDLLEQATEAAARRARSMGDLDDQARRRRLFGFLARRGYDHETCRRAIESALGRPSDD